ncbi:putative oxidoreductase YcjS [Maioricimonas rarisocia]|uniref:Putative oxidoreductase YcjS n=1 Tax=Maioricimonas rarisocia TaxID=2528026 RepID=A0A517Z2Q0_9PLAN|nr:Gfo/Idh/MocA family oxidoreductase [Maioricimonas rarisocia]QDU36735.1 putative oxidoreductase YcjS [Maioricimonas rarisocia]
MTAHQAWRFGVVGCGRMGHLHSERLQADGRGQVVALFDESPEAARRLQQEKAASARLCSSFEDLLATEPLDAVVICTPTTAHFDQVHASLARGVHVLCEKPLAESRQRILDLIAAAGRSDRHCMLAYQRRFWWTYRTLRREVRSGQWGPIRAVTSHNVERWQQTIAGTWRDDPAVNVGGFVGDAGSHKIDAVFYVTGLAPVDAWARSQNQGSHVQVNTSVSGRLAGDVLLCMDFIGNAQYLGEDLHIHCEHADLMLRDRKVWIAEGNAVRELTDPEPDSNPDVGFLDLLDGVGKNIAPFDCALPVWDLTAAILQSGEQGTLVEL